MTKPKLNASSRIMREEAQKRGVQCTTFGDNETILMEKNGKTWYTRGSRTSLQSSIGRTIADSKYITKKILSHFNIPTAKFVLVKKIEDLAKIKQLNFPLVMKPVRGAHGRGVIVGVKTEQEAKKYFLQAGSKVIFEEVLKGTEYRIICIDYKFVGATFRKAAFITGDGKNTIKELVKIKNQDPNRQAGHKGNLTLIEIDKVVIENLNEQKMTPNTIPVKNEEVFLRKTANLSTGGEPHDYSHLVCKENKELFSKIAKACDLNSVGIDIMCQSLETPIVDQKNVGVIEVNASPGLRMHHFPLVGKSINVASKILDMVMTKK